MPKGTRDTTKCRERLLVEEFIYAAKEKGTPLYFTAEDIWQYSKERVDGLPAVRVNLRGLRKALQNMVYAKAGVGREKSGGPGVPVTYVVTVDTHNCWSENPTQALAGAQMSTRKQYAVKRKPRKEKASVPAVRPPIASPLYRPATEPMRAVPAGDSVDEMRTEILRLRNEISELRRTAAGVLYTVTEAEYKGHPVLTFSGPGMRTPLTLGLSKLRAVEANWPYVVEFLAKNTPAVPATN